MGPYFLHQCIDGDVGYLSLDEQQRSHRRSDKTHHKIQHRDDTKVHRINAQLYRYGKQDREENQDDRHCIEDTAHEQEKYRTEHKEGCLGHIQANDQVHQLLTKLL